MGQQKGLTVKIGAAGALAGGIVGFLLRPSSMILGQLPFEMVITRGANLKGMDQILIPLAQKSFNIMLAGSIVGAAIGLLAGYFIEQNTRTRTPVTKPKEKHQPMTRKKTNKPLLENGERELGLRQANALFAAVEEASERKLSALLQEGLNIEARNGDGLTPLMVAAKEGLNPIAKLLLDSGCNPNSIDPDGDTPLIFAARGGHIDVAKLLLHNGADPRLRNAVGKTAFHFASRKRYYHIVELLEELGANE